MFIQNTFSDSSLTVLLVSLLVFYPIFGSIVWIVGAIKYRSMIKTNTPVIPEGMVLPKVSIWLRPTMKNYKLIIQSVVCFTT